MITPIEIRQQSFKKAFRGYDREEVDAFLHALSQEWERQLEASKAIKEELDRVQSSYNTLKEVENMLHKTLIQAEQSSRDTLDNARQKAEIKLREADAQANEIVRKGIEDRDGVQKEISELSRKRDQLLIQLRGFLKTQLDYLDTYQLTELPPAKPKENLPPVPNGKKEHNSQLKSVENLFETKENGTSGEKNLLDDIMSEL